MPWRRRRRHPPQHRLHRRQHQLQRRLPQCQRGLVPSLQPGWRAADQRRGPMRRVGSLPLPVAAARLAAWRRAGSPQVQRRVPGRAELPRAGSRRGAGARPAWVRLGRERPGPEPLGPEPPERGRVGCPSELQAPAGPHRGRQTADCPGSGPGAGDAAWPDRAAPDRPGDPLPGHPKAPASSGHGRRPRGRPRREEGRS